MNIWQAFIIGLLQGLTEFLPISSSGHMLLAGKVLDADVSIAFELVMHLATLSSVLVVMRKDVFKLIKKPLSKEMQLLVLATIPTVIIAFVFEDFFLTTYSGAFLPYCFLLTAIFLIASGFIKGTLKKEISYGNALIIGAVQGFAVLPGISRSGSTISTSIMLGNSKTDSARFSFLLSIPIIIGTSLIAFVKGGYGSFDFLPMLAGFVAAFGSGLLALKFMLKRLGDSFDYFAIYLLALSIFLFINELFLNWF